MTVPHPTQHYPRQLALPLHLPLSAPIADDGAPISPQVLWRALLPAERERFRQHLLAVLREAVHERAPY